LRAALRAGQHEVHVLYTEPEEYKPKEVSLEGAFFDLSEETSKPYPLPGFAKLAEQPSFDAWFVPLLGFEGFRLSRLLDQLEPAPGKTLPVIGVPGFRPEYPFHTYHGNQIALQETKSWKEVRFASANCPFSLFYLLEDIAADHPDDLLQIAPIGTKPHALGAVLFYLTRPGSVELVYDHPLRKKGRTQGKARLLDYHVYKLAEWPTLLAHDLATPGPETAALPPESAAL
jgi:hypothetical protein